MVDVEDPAMVPQVATERAASVRLLAMDVDGVLTDGSLYIGPALELKCFSVADGLGIVLALRAGIKVAWVTGRSSESVRQRARELGITALYEGAANKRQGLLNACERLGVPPAHAAYIGDDLNDLPAFAASGLKIAVANAAPELKQQADWVTTASGGHGAVREVCLGLLKRRGDWPEILRGYLESLEARTECRQ
ncbi:MAG TPA: HAD hydrolase family protein [Armatimonadota bacterium]|jgi:3-deoxy-D-manno-octulosonate 8-phosphate phosphatase (KDO 8-P phosphatase)